MAKIIMALTNVDEYIGHPEHKTGVWLEEAVSFYAAVIEAGHEVTFASNNGGAVPIDPRSAQAGPDIMKKAADEKFKHGMNNTIPFDTINPDDYAAIYFCGGHGTMWDFPNSKGLQNLAQSIYAHNGFIASVCHGEAGLVGLKDEDGSPLVKGKKINGFTNEEEDMNGMSAIVPFSPEDELVRLGAEFVNGAPYTAFAVSDQHFITGQNPMSSRRVAELLIRELNA